MSAQYDVDVAIAPELIPILDSLKNFGSGMTSIEDLLQQLLEDKNVTYQIIDGNKILLRSDGINPPKDNLILIKGTILDKRDHTALPYCAVSILNSQKGTYTDDMGHFNLYVDKHATALQISYLGYKTVIVPVEKFSSSETIEMEVDNIPLDQVVVIVPFYQMSPGDEFQSLDLKGYQFVSTDDLLYWNSEQLISNLTGYTHFSSEEGIRIRSSEEENSLIMMDGIPVYDPYHFYNIFSPFNGHYFSSVNVYKNNMPVEFGGRIDGLIELGSMANKEGSQLIFDTDLLLTSMSAVIDVTDNIIISAGSRFSHTGLLNNSLRDSTSANFSIPGKFRDENEWTSSREPQFNFYDINLGINVKAGNRSEISLAYFHNKDYLENLISTDLSAMVKNQEVISIGQEIDSRDDWKNEGFSAGLRTKLDDHTHVSVNGFLSSFEKKIEFDASRDERFLEQTRSFFNTGFQNSILQSRGLKAFIKNEVPDHTGYIIGVDFQQHEVDLIASENGSPYLLELQEENETTLFGEYNYPISKDLRMAVGGRFTYLNSTSAIYPQPNVRMNYLLDDKWKLKTSFSKNIQVVRELTVENRFGREIEFLALSQPDAAYPLLKSDKYMLGAGYETKNFVIDGEFYYKKINGLISVRAPRPDPSFNNVTSPAEFYRMLIGEEWITGFDLLAVYKFGRSENSVSYTLSKISQQFDQLFNGNPFSPKEDRRHQIKLSSQYKIGQFVASGLITYKTKAPYVSLVRLEGRDGIGMVDQSMVLRYLPPYFSLDLALDYSFRIFKQTALVGASVINFTDHENINDIQHIGRISREAGMKDLFLTYETELLGRTMNVHFRILLN